MVARAQLKVWRQKKELSQREAALLVGVSQSAWSDWEAGKKIPQLIQAMLIEKHCAIPVKAWLADEKQLRSAIAERKR